MKTPFKSPAAPRPRADGGEEPVGGGALGEKGSIDPLIHHVMRGTTPRNLAPQLIELMLAAGTPRPHNIG